MVFRELSIKDGFAYLEYDAFGGNAELDVVL